MSKRIFLHLGTPKTGTTFIQSVLWANKDVIESQGVLLPLQRQSDHFNLSVIARHAESQLRQLNAHAKSSWSRMLDQVAEWPGDALISHELFSMCSAARAEWTIDQLRSVADEVHPVVTARDLGRQLPAEWQQTIKHGRAHKIGEFYRLVKAHDKGVVFWRAQGLVELLESWSQGLPTEHVHIVTVPPPGAPRELLWNRFAELVGIDPGSVDQTINRPNESLGLDEIETLRRVNAASGKGATSARRQLLTRAVLADEILAARAGGRKFVPPPDEHPWVVETGTEVVEALKSRGYDVVGDLADLVPAEVPLTGNVPDDATDSTVAGVAVDAIAQLLDRMQGQQIRSLQERLKTVQAQLEARSTRVTNLEAQLKAAIASYERERDLPLWKHAGRRVRNLARAGLGRGRG